MPELKTIEIANGLLTPQQAADFLGIKLSTIYAMCMRRQIPCVKIGRLNRFRRQDLDRWVEEHLQESRNSNEKNV